MSKTSKIRRARKARDKAVYDAKLMNIIAHQAEKSAAAAKTELGELQSSWEYHQKAVIQVLGPNTSLLEARTFRSDQPIRRMDSYHPVMTDAAPTIADVRDTEISIQRMHEIQVCFHQIKDEFMKQLRREVHLLREDGDNFYYAHTLSRDEKNQPIEAQKHMISNLFNAAKTRYLEEFERTYSKPKKPEGLWPTSHEKQVRIMESDLMEKMQYIGSLFDPDPELTQAARDEVRGNIIKSPTGASNET